MSVEAYFEEIKRFDDPYNLLNDARELILVQYAGLLSREGEQDAAKNAYEQLLDSNKNGSKRSRL